MLISRSSWFFFIKFFSPFVQLFDVNLFQLFIIQFTSEVIPGQNCANGVFVCVRGCWDRNQI